MASIARCDSAEGNALLLGRKLRAIVIGFSVASDVPNEPSAETAALVATLDPEVRDAIGDVDRTLIVLALQQSPWDRLRSASRMAQTLVRIRDGIAPESR